MKSFLHAACAGVLLLFPFASVAQMTTERDLTSLEKRHVDKIVRQCAHDALFGLAKLDAEAHAQGKEVRFSLVQPDQSVVEVTRDEYVANAIQFCFVLRGPKDPVLAPRFEEVRAPPTSPANHS